VVDPFFSFFGEYEMKGIHKVLIALGAIAVVLFLIFSYIGVIQIPILTQSIQGYENGTELQFTDVNQFLIGENVNVPQLESMGLTIRIFGTNDSLTLVKMYFQSLMSRWNLSRNENTMNSAILIWKQLASGFGVAIITGSRVLSQTGYKTLFITIEGPTSAWLKLEKSMD